VHILLINQTFYPDVAATAQYLADLAFTLAQNGHRVTVIASRRSYTEPDVIYARSETWQGVKITRCWSSSFGKGAKWRRALDSLSFLLSCAFRLCLVRDVDKVVALTSPPLVSALGAAYARVIGAQFHYWVMDLNPDEAIAAGWLRADSLPAKILDALSRFSLKSANEVVALDRFMKERLLAKGTAPESLSVIPPWPQDNIVAADEAGARAFRDRHRLTGKFVVMYSGNHSPCHPLDSLMQAALALRELSSAVFCFVGGGSEFARVQHFAQEYKLNNILCLGYQPLNQLSASLSAADLHAVVMGDPFVGIVHPCKVYNIKQVGVPFFCIGPEQNPIAELGPVACFRHSQAQGLADFIRCAAISGVPASGDSFVTASSRDVLLNQLVTVIGGQSRMRLQPARG